MSLKFFFLVLISAALAVADNERDYYEISRQRDAKVVQSYFLTEDQLSARLQWDLIWARIVYVVANGKQKALELAEISQIDQVKKEWTYIEELDVTIEIELKTIVNSLRSAALEKAPRQWSQLTQLAIKFHEATVKAAREGDANQLKKVKVEYMGRIRKLSANIRAIIASKSKRNPERN